MSVAATHATAPARDGGGLVARGLVKRYGATTALAGVDVEIAPGRILALLGENGAGKSTLVKILAAATAPDAGGLTLDGRPLTLREPRDAIAAGVVHISQELAYAPDLTVAENIALGHWPGRGGRVSWAAMRADAARQLARLSADISVRATMRTLGLAERQIVEIAKALSRDARVLLLDEPTASLSALESAHLFDVVHRLADAGVAIAFITHRMDEVLAHSDRVIVLRNGATTLDTPTDAVAEQDLVAAMVPDTPPTAHDDLGGPRAGKRMSAVVRVPALGEADVELELVPGEVLGLFGVRGAGCEAIVEGLAGASRALLGAIEIDGRRRRLFASPREARDAGVVFVPAERKAAGLVMTQSIRFNVELMSHAALSRAGVVSGRRARRLGRTWIDRLNVRCRDVAQGVAELSGGNQQKVLLASRLAVTGSSILLLHEPTRGIDVGARAEVHQIVRDTAAAGAAVLIASSDVEECVNVSDRLVVIRQGRAVAELAGARRTQAAALALATGEQS